MLPETWWWNSFDFHLPNTCVIPNSNEKASKNGSTVAAKTDIKLYNNSTHFKTHHPTTTQQSNQNLLFQPLHHWQAIQHVDFWGFIVVKDLSTLTQAISLHVCSIDLGNSSRHDSSKIWGLTAASSLCKSIQCRHVQDYGVFFPHFSIKSLLETQSQESGHQCIGGLSMNDNNQFLNRIYHLIPYSHEKDSNWFILLNLF